MIDEQTNLELFIKHVKSKLSESNINLKEIIGFRALTDMSADTGLLLVDFKWEGVSKQAKEIVEEAEIVPVEGEEANAE